jgi:RNA polymerase II elongation factor ELL
MLIRIQRTAIVGYGELPPPKNARRNGQLRKAPYLKKGNRNALSTTSSGVSTPTAKAARSPLGSTPTSSTSAETQAKLDALRIPLIHLLALGPTSESSLASKTRATGDMCLKVLQRVANKVKAGRQWALMDDIYKELDVWDFPYASSEDRHRAIGNCREAFQKLRLDKQAAEWRQLLSPEDRDRADISPEQASESVKPISARSSVKAASDSGRSPLITSTEMKRSTTEAPKPVPKAAKSNPITRIISGKGKKKAPAAVKPKGPIGRPPRNLSNGAKLGKPATAKHGAPNPKIKSAEMIKDSDEEIEMEDVAMSPHKQPATRTVVPPQVRPVKKPMPKNSPDVDVDGIRLQPNAKNTSPSAASKSPVKRPRTSAPSSASSNSPAHSNGHARATQSISKALGHRDPVPPRSSSNSPPKPSPLGSSPPISALDVDSVSSSSSPSFLTSNAGTSTASQSPLDSLSGRGRRPRYVPVAGSTLKRKGGPISGRDESTRTGHPAATHTGNSVPNKRQNLGTPDSQTMKLARKFKEDYTRYERLHKEAQAMRDSSRRKNAIELVITLHQNLERLKREITSLQAAH